MAIDLRPRRVHFPVIPSSNVVRQRLQELQDEARKLDILLRLANELEQTTTPLAKEGQEVDRG